ncbi:MAG: hypothetical protein Q9222_005972 [Ikaeria aurantiellina]
MRADDLRRRGQKVNDLYGFGLDSTYKDDTPKTQWSDDPQDSRSRKTFGPSRIPQIPPIPYISSNEHNVSIHGAQEEHTEYNLPRNDAAEFARLDDQANGFTELMNNKIVYAPLENPKRLLDVGCGTGNSSCRLAQQYPSATVYGVDISPVPSFSKAPSNLEYVTGDIKRLASNDGGDERINRGDFDYIYQSLLICGMTDWPGYLRQMILLLKPGGYLEMHEVAETWYKTSSSSSSLPNREDPIISHDWKWMQAMRRGAEQLGLDTDIGINAEQYMKDAGLADVQVAKYPVPFGTWMAEEKPETKKIGGLQDPNMGVAFSNNILPGVTRTLGIGEEEMGRLKEECRRCLAEEKGKYWWFYSIVGRKL